MRFHLLLSLLLLAACGGEPQPAPDDALPRAGAVVTSPTALIEAMRARNDGAWYETLTFVQETVQHRQDGSVDTSTWYEAYAAPGRLRIDFAPVEDGNGLLFRSDSQYVFQNGALAGARAVVHPLLLLGFDVYHLPVEETVARLERLGFDLTTWHEATWEGRSMVVVGAAEGDTGVSQFWIDREDLVFRRLLRPMGPDSSATQEVQFNNYQRLGEGWIAPEVVFLVNGDRVMLETYREMRTGMALDSALFDPTRWRTARWRE